MHIHCCAVLSNLDRSLSFDGSYWNRARILLWAALRYRADAYEPGLEDALERIGCLLQQHGYSEGWTIFNLEICP